MPERREVELRTAHRDPEQKSLKDGSRKVGQVMAPWIVLSQHLFPEEVVQEGTG